VASIIKVLGPELLSMLANKLAKK